MPPELQPVVVDAFRVAFRAALASGGLGLLLGLLIGVAAHLGLAAAGAYEGSHRLNGLGRGLAALYTVGVSGLLVAVAGMAGGAYAGAAPALLQSDLRAGFFEPTGELAADMALQAIALGPELAGAPALPDAPAPDDVLAAAREGRWAPTPAQVRASATAWEAALRGPEGEQVARALTARATADLPPKPADLARGALIRITNAVRAGKGVDTVDPALADAWEQLDAAASADGDPATLSRRDLVTLAIDGVILPIGLRPLLGVAVPVIAVSLALLLPAWGLPVGIAWALRRLVRAPREGT